MPDLESASVPLTEDFDGRGSTPERSGAQRWCSKDRQSNSHVAASAANGYGRIASGPAAATPSASNGAGSQDAREALERELEQPRRERRIARRLTLAELIEIYLAQHDVQSVTIEKLRYLLR